MAKWLDRRVLRVPLGRLGWHSVRIATEMCRVTGSCILMGESAGTRLADHGPRYDVSDMRVSKSFAVGSSFLIRKILLYFFSCLLFDFCYAHH